MNKIEPPPSGDSKRITFASMVHEAVHAITHVESNFIFTLKNLFIRPGKMIREYILGKRSKYQKPFGMLFICIALFSLTMWVFIELNPVHLSPSSGWNEVFEYNFQYIVLYKYFSWIQLALVPLYGLILKLFNWKSYYNYGELVVLYCYLFSGILLILIPLIISQQFLPVLRLPFIEASICVVYAIWVCIDFFRPTGESIGLIILKTVLGTVISYFIMMFTYRAITWLLTWWHFH
jgi:hypothetical protein